MKHWKICAAAVLASAGCIAAALVWNNSTDQELFRIKKSGEGISVSFDKLYSSYEPYSLSIPLKYLKIARDDIKDFKPTCSCSVASVDKETGELKINLDLNEKSGKFSQSIAVIPKDPQIRPEIISIKGDVIPKWYWKPALVKADNILPDETRNFQCLVNIQYDLDEIAVDELRLSRPQENIKITHEILNGKSISIAGEIRGLKNKKKYKGSIQCALQTDRQELISIPVEISYHGVIQHSPEVITLQKAGEKEIHVSFEHYLGRELKIRKVTAPDHISARISGKKIVTKIKRAEKTPLTSEINVEFEGLDFVTSIPVVILGSV